MRLAPQPRPQVPPARAEGARISRRRRHDEIAENRYCNHIDSDQRELAATVVETNEPVGNCEVRHQGRNEQESRGEAKPDAGEHCRSAHALVVSRSRGDERDRAENVRGLGHADNRRVADR